MLNSKKYLTVDITNVRKNGETYLLDALDENEVQSAVREHIDGLQDKAWEIDTIINIETLRDSDNDTFIRMHLLIKQGVSNNVKDEDLV